MKKINLIIILLAIFSITMLAGCANKQTDIDGSQTCSIDQVEAQVCE